MEPKARINHAKPYTVEHNLRVYNFGMVHRRYLTELRAQYDWVLNLLDAQHKLNHGQAIDDDDGDGEGDDNSEDDDDTTQRRRDQDTQGKSTECLAKMWKFFA